MKYRFFFFIALCCLSVPPKAYQNRIKIAPYGDSITQAAKSRYSYRYFLWKKLLDAGIEFDYVGTMNSNRGGCPKWPDYKNKPFDKDHEGHWGWRANQILKKMDGWLTEYTPDMVLLHIGTNDCLHDKQSADGILSEINQIIEHFRKDNPEVTVFLASLIPCKRVGSYINALNEKIPGFTQEINTAKSPVIFVDQNSGFDNRKDLYDGIHPGLSGEEKMAQKWFDAISNFSSPKTLTRNHCFNPVISSARKPTNPSARISCSLLSQDSQTAVEANLVTEGFIFTLQGKRLLNSSSTGYPTGQMYIIQERR